MSSAASNIFVTTGTFGLLAASACLLASATIFNQISTGPKVVVDTKPWEWLSELKLGVEKSEPMMDPAPAQIPAALNFDLNAPVKKFVAKKKTSFKLARKAAKKKRVLAKAVAGPGVQAMPVQPASVFDEIKMTAAAPEKALESQAPAIQTPTIDEAPEGATHDELQKMQEMHDSLHRHFVIAFAHPNLDPVPTEMVAIQDAAPQKVVAPVKRTLTTQKKKFKIARSIAVKKQQKLKPKRIEIAKVSQPEPVAPPEKHALELSIQKPVTDEIHVVAAAPVVEAAKADIKEALPPTVKLAPPEPIAPQPITEMAQAPSVPTTQIAPVVAEPTVSIAPENVQIQTQAAPKSEADYSNPAEYSLSVGQAKVVVTQPAAPAQVATVAQAAPAPYIPAAPVTDGEIQPSNAPTQDEPVPQPDSAPQPEPFPGIGTQYVEAFSWSDTVSDGFSESLTKTPSQSLSRGWKQAQATLHWPTLYWDSSTQAAGIRVPLISNNTAQMLARVAGSTLHAETGIVFGKVPAGWQVEFSGRSDHAVFLSSKNQPIDPSDTRDMRYFALLNTAPGAHLIYVTTPGGRGNGAVGLPVISGAATYIDLSIIAKKKFSGIVMDASASEPKPLKNVQVRVIGQASAAVITNARGEFQIDHIVSVGNYPLYIETVASKGFTHRYQLGADRWVGSVLYRIQGKQILDWVGQLEGGVSSESSVILAAVPGVIGARDDGNLFPVTRSLTGRSTLTPETYTISPSGQLQVKTPLSPNTTRFISVQVPEGPVLSMVEDNNRNMIWSELVMSSPGVVNLVGPY